MVVNENENDGIVELHSIGLEMLTKFFLDGTFSKFPALDILTEEIVDVHAMGLEILKKYFLDGTFS